MNPLRTSMMVGAVVAGATCWACSDGTVGIGEDNPQAAKTGLAAYAGSWDGYVEAYTFESGTSGRVRLVIDEEGQGQLRFGDRDLVPKPMEPNVRYYPPQAEESGVSIREESAASTRFYTAFEGFNYALQASIVQSSRIRTGASTCDVYRDYCAIQTSLYPYRYCANGTSSDCAWVVGYGRTPVTFVGLESLGGNDCNIIVFDQAPTTLDQLTTNPTHSFPCGDLGPEMSVEEFNLKHPDFPMLSGQPVNEMCARNADGTHQLDPRLAQTLDIKLDGALENGGASLVGSLTIPQGQAIDNTTIDSVVRTVRLTREQ